MAIRKSILEQKYVFEYDIGQWTFGTISVLRDRDTDQLKHCKTVPKDMVQTAQNVVPQLLALRELQHPHICTLTDVLEDGGHYYIISDYQQGGDVQDWLERLDESSWLQEQTCAMYVRQLMLALTHSHSVQVYHRDLRPSNLLLTSKLPDAVVKVGDLGLAAILDPDNSIIQRNPTPFTDPEVLKSFEPQRSGVADMWSVGAVAHALLVGHAPSHSASSRSSGWGLTHRFHSTDDESWEQRSPLARDFVMRLLRRPPAARSTAARALQHPWLKGLTPLKGVQWRADNDVARELRHKTLCYTLSVILLPVVVPFRDFEQLRVAFQQSDADRDGFVQRSIAQRLLLSRCNILEAVRPALNIVDVYKTDSFDLAAVACADLIVREFFAAGPTAAPLIGPFSPTDLAPRLLKRFFEVFGDRKGGAAQATASSGTVKSKIRTATAKDLETNAGIVYEEVLACLPEDSVVDGQSLTTQLSASAGRGTPLSCDGQLSPLHDEDPWGNFGIDMLSIFRSCAAGSEREGSPHSIRIF